MQRKSKLPLITFFIAVGNYSGVMCLNGILRIGPHNRKVHDMAYIGHTVSSAVNGGKEDTGNCPEF